MTDPTADLLAVTDRYSAHNYHPLPVVISEADGAWVTDVAGRRYLDCLAGYSALNFGHRHPGLVAVAKEQLDRVTLTSRAFHNDRLGAFCHDLADLTGLDRVLPMNTGAEAVETSIKIARKWGYDVKGIAPDAATIIVADGNFHGRTTTIVSFSTDHTARAGFGPFTPGFIVVPFGDAEALRAAIGPETVAVLIEPIQGEAGVLIPPDGYLAAVRRACDDANVLLIADEIQSGLCRTGRTFACDHEGVTPDMYVLGKALGGGIVPVSAVAARAEVMEVITPGTHGSTFGGNPLAAAVGSAVVDLVRTGGYQERAAALGERLHERLLPLMGDGLVGMRSRGLWFGLDIDPALMTGREACERLAGHGVLAKDTHGSTIRLAPPLVVSEDDLMWAAERFEVVLAEATAGVRLPA